MPLAATTPYTACAESKWPTRTAALEVFVLLACAALFEPDAVGPDPDGAGAEPLDDVFVVLVAGSVTFAGAAAKRRDELCAREHEDGRPLTAGRHDGEVRARRVDLGEIGRVDELDGVGLAWAQSDVRA